MRRVSEETPGRAVGIGASLITLKRLYLVSLQEAELEMSGIIYSVPGIGSFVSADALENNLVKQKAKSALTDALGVSKSVGITKEEIREIIESIYGGEDND